MIKYILVSIWIAAFFTPQAAQAYLDPGTGSYIIQIVIGVVAGAIFALKIYWTKAKGFARSVVQKSAKHGNSEE
jgi:hypothetical protein